MISDMSEISDIHEEYYLSHIWLDTRPESSGNVEGD